MEPLLLSKSRLNTYCLCPEKYRLTYVEKIVPEKTAIPLIEGSALHHIVENCLVYGKTVPNMARRRPRNTGRKSRFRKPNTPMNKASPRLRKRF